MTIRRRATIGATAAVGAFLALGASPAPAAHADFDDLFQPIIDALSVVDPGIAADTDPGSALASLDTLVDGWYQNLVTTPINDLEHWIFGGADPGSAAASAAGAADASTAGTTGATTDYTSFTVPLQVNGGTEPVVNVSVGGGSSEPVLVDTGSNGLVMPFQDVWSDINWSDLTSLPTIQYGEYGSSLGYFYVQLPTTISFDGTGADAGQTITSGPTDVDAVLFAFPVSFSGLLNGDWSIYDYLGGSSLADAQGILGIGANAVGPNTTSVPTAALPGDLGKGVLIDQPNQQLVFEAQPSGGITVSGSPNANLEVGFNGGTPSSVSSVIDSGGVYGTMPGVPAGDVLKAGTTVQVYTSEGQQLYSYTINSSSSNSPSSAPADGTMNTGNVPFANGPVYISYANGGSTTFYPAIEAGS